MKSFLMKMDISNRYSYIRHVYNELGGNIELTHRILSVSKNTIYNSISNVQPNQRIYKKKLDEVHTIFIHARTIEDPHISGEKLSNELFQLFDIKISGRTINRYRKEMELMFRPPIRSVFISNNASIKRFEFSKYHLENQTNFKNIVFTDESWFQLGRNKRWVWIDKRNITNDVISKQIANPEKVMVWGGIGYQFKTELVFVEGNLDSENYIDQIIFGSDLIEAADHQYGIGGWLLMQDNARPHISRETISVLNELEIKLLQDWPPYSPDLNVIEVISNVWNNLQFETINGLIDGIPNRLRKVYEHPDRTIFKISSSNNEKE